VFLLSTTPVHRRAVSDGDGHPGRVLCQQRAPVRDRASDAEGFGKIATPTKNKVPPSARLESALQSVLTSLSETVLASSRGKPDDRRGLALRRPVRRLQQIVVVLSSNNTWRR